MTCVQLDLFKGKEKKRLGQKRVVENNNKWLEECIHVIDYIPSGNRFTLDQLRQHIAFRPTHHNAWGSLMSAAAKEGLIKKTGLYVKSQRPSAHARLLAEWVRI